MNAVYPACFFKEENGYSVIFPDLNWLATCGDTLEEAERMAVDCLAGYLYTMREDGETVSPPSAMKDISPAFIMRELEVASGEAFVRVVSVDVAQYAKAHFYRAGKSVTGEQVERWVRV